MTAAAGVVSGLAGMKGKKAMGLKAGRIEMAGTLSGLGAELGCLRAEGKLKRDGGCRVEVGFMGVRFFPSSPRSPPAATSMS